MTLADFYLVCFVVGFFLSLLMFLAGGLHLHIPHFHGHAETKPALPRSSENRSRFNFAPVTQNNEQKQTKDTKGLVGLTI